MGYTHLRISLTHRRAGSRMQRGRLRNPFLSVSSSRFVPSKDASRLYMRNRKKESANIFSGSGFFGATRRGRMSIVVPRFVGQGPLQLPLPAWTCRTGPARNQQSQIPPTPWWPALRAKLWPSARRAASGTESWRDCSTLPTYPSSSRARNGYSQCSSP